MPTCCSRSTPDVLNNTFTYKQVVHHLPLTPLVKTGWPCSLPSVCLLVRWHVREVKVGKAGGDWLPFRSWGGMDRARTHHPRTEPTNDLTAGSARMNEDHPLGVSQGKNRVADVVGAVETDEGPACPAPSAHASRSGVSRTEAIASVLAAMNSASSGGIRSSLRMASAVKSTRTTS